MKIDRNNWLETFNEQSIPTWKCPSCYKGFLGLKEPLCMIPSVASLKYDEDDPEQNLISGRFKGELHCQNSKCGEKIVVAGKYSTDEVDDNSGTLYTKRLAPRYFEPTPHVFELDELLPWDIRENLERSFTLFWTDKAACANVVRTVVENIMDDQKIRKTKDTTSGRVRRALHDRLTEFELANSDIAHYLKAIKWIGNNGSHSDYVDEDTLLDGFELLQLALDKLYGEDHEARLKSLATNINQRKGR